MDADFARKLGIKGGHVVRLLSVAEEFRRELGRLLPPSCRVEQGETGGQADIVILWANEATAGQFPALQAQLQPAGALWVVIPKKTAAGKLGSRVTFDGIQAAALATSDLVDNKTLTFSEAYYGIRFVIRREKRPRV